MDFLSSLFESIIESFFAFPILAYKRGGVLCVLAFIGFILKLAFPYVLKLDSREQYSLFFLWFLSGAFLTGNKELALIYVILRMLSYKKLTDKTVEEEKEL